MESFSHISEVPEAGNEDATPRTVGFVTSSSFFQVIFRLPGWFQPCFVPPLNQPTLETCHANESLWQNQGRPIRLPGNEGPKTRKGKVQLLGSCKGRWKKDHLCMCIYYFKHIYILWKVCLQLKWFTKKYLCVLSNFIIIIIIIIVIIKHVPKPSKTVSSPWQMSAYLMSHITPTIPAVTAQLPHLFFHLEG